MITNSYTSIYSHWLTIFFWPMKSHTPPISWETGVTSITLRFPPNVDPSCTHWISEGVSGLIIHWFLPPNRHNQCLATWKMTGSKKINHQLIYRGGSRFVLMSPPSGGETNYKNQTAHPQSVVQLDWVLVSPREPWFSKIHVWRHNQLARYIHDARPVAKGNDISKHSSFEVGRLRVRRPP